MWLLLVLLLLPVASSAREQRCTDLVNDGDPNTICECSEPFDTDATGVLNAPDSTDYECYGGSAADSNPGTVMPLASTGVDAATYGLSGPTWVRNWIPVPAGFSITMPNGSRSFTQGTACFRHYHQFAAGSQWPLTSGNPYNIKGPRMQNPTVQQLGNCEPTQQCQPGLEAAWRGSGSVTGSHLRFTMQGGTGHFQPGGRVDGDGKSNPAPNNPVNFAECTEPNWCRIELCVDHDPAGAFFDDTIYVRSLVVQLGTGKAQTDDGSGPSTSYTAIGLTGNVRETRTPHPTAYTGDASRIKMIFNQPNSTASGNPTPERWSHAMAARVFPADPTFWIGPASEVDENFTPPTVVPTNCQDFGVHGICLAPLQ